MKTKDVAFIENTMERKVIYVYEKCYDEEKGFIKIGDASIDTPNEDLRDNSDYLKKVAEKRIRGYELSSPINILYVSYAVKDDYTGFRDYQVHEVLERSGIKKIKKGNSREWFEADISVAISAIEAVKKGYSTIEGTELVFSDNKPIKFRPEQLEAINQTKSVFKTKNDMLWNAKMRFGKTLSSLEVIKENGFNKTLILTHRPIVDDGWYEDFMKLFGNTTYKYGSKRNGHKLNELLKGKNSFVYFSSMQDLRGSKPINKEKGFDKNEELFCVDWDFLIIDEAHEGTKTDLAEDVVTALRKNNTKVLKLSGTPFNLLDEYEESQIYTWDYVMEQEAKKNWDDLYEGDSNPYSSLPEMRMFVYELGKIIENNNFYDLETRAFNFAEFFRTKDDQTSRFIYEKEVWDFLNLISKSEDFSKERTNMPFSSIEYRNELRHTLWTLPTIKACNALEKMLNKHNVFNTYNIANLVSTEDEEKIEDLEKIRKAITREPEKNYSITLTVRRGTVGTTVKEWTGILVLNNTESASNYLQSIFRVQSPYSGKFGEKEKAYVFDFAPDRSLKMVAEAAKLNIKGGGLNTQQQKSQMAHFLNFLPIVSVEGSNMAMYSVDKMLTQLKRAQAERAVRNGFDDTSIYNDELLKLSEADIKEFENLKRIVGQTKQSKKLYEININNQGLTDEEWEAAERAEKKKKKDRTADEIKALEEKKKISKQRQTMISILRGISIRIPLMIYGMKLDIKEDVTIDNFVNHVDDVSWNEFMPIGVTKAEFNKFKKYYDGDVFIESGRKIRGMAQSADRLAIEERIEKITNIFAGFKNPDKETVLTPWRVVNLHLGETLGGYNFFDKQYSEIPNKEEIRSFIDYKDITKKVFSKDTKVLEINSKTGLYPLYMAYSIYKTRWHNESANWYKSEWAVNEQSLWKDVLENNIYVLNKTPMAKTITYRTLYGYKKSKKLFDNLVYIENINSKFRDSVDDTIAEIMKKFEGEIMKFDVVVGNPPYQETVRAASGGNNANTIDVFQYFQESALKLGKVNSLIYPAKELQRGKMNVLDKRLKKVRIYNGSAKESEKNIPGEDSVFGDAVRRIPGDVGIFLWDIDNVEEKVCYQGTYIERTDKILPVRKEFLELASNLEKYAGSFAIGTLRKCCESNFVEKNPKSVLGEVENRKDKTPLNYTKVLTNNKGGSGGKAKWYYIKTDDLDFIQPPQYKVVIGSAFPIEGFKKKENIEILEKDEMFGRTKVSLYCSENIEDARNFKKFTNTLFVEVIANMTPLKFLYYLPNFNELKSKINWDLSLEQIDEQLFTMFNIGQEQKENLKNILNFKY